MTIETQIFTALKSLVANRVYRDVAPETVTDLPRITFQAIGGEAINFLDTATIPSKRQCRVQVNVWAARRDDANSLARQVEDALRAYTALQTHVLSGFVAVYDEDTKLFGTMQDFQVWA
jgi:hypothetical protein